MRSQGQRNEERSRSSRDDHQRVVNLRSAAIQRRDSEQHARGERDQDREPSFPPHQQADANRTQPVEDILCRPSPRRTTEQHGRRSKQPRRLSGPCMARCSDASSSSLNTPTSDMRDRQRQSNDRGRTLISRDRLDGASLHRCPFACSGKRRTSLRASTRATDHRQSKLMRKELDHDAQATVASAPASPSTASNRRSTIR